MSDENEKWIAVIIIKGTPMIDHIIEKDCKGKKAAEKAARRWGRTSDYQEAVFLKQADMDKFQPAGEDVEANWPEGVGRRAGPPQED